MVIAIDGPAGSGKSTIAKLLAQKLHDAEGKGFDYINSGKLYRAIALGCLRTGIDPADNESVITFARDASIQYQNDRLVLNGEDVTEKLHTDEIDLFSAPLSAIVPVRHIVNDIIRNIAKGENVVVEGRDMTSVVFPNAEHRFFLDASVETRAMRRFGQGVSQLGLDEIKTTITQRDEIDRNKIEGSLVISEKVVYIDTSDLTINQVYDILEEKIKWGNQNRGKKMDNLEVVADTSPLDNSPAGNSLAGKGSYGTNQLNLQSPDISESDALKKNTPNAGLADETADSASVKNANSFPGESKDEENIQTQLQEEYLKTLEQLEEGQLVVGVVVQVNEDHVFIDVGYKSEGKIPISAFAQTPKIGDSVPVVLIAKENKRGEVIVSKQKADEKITWKNIKSAHQDNSVVEGTIEKAIKGGFEVNLGSGIKAFLPIRQADVLKIDSPEKLVGEKTFFHVERVYSEGKINIIVNRRKYLEEEFERKRKEFFDTIPIGTDVNGIVKSFTSFGAFIDLGGFDGLLHINDMSWGHVTRPKEFVRKGQEIRLKVIRIDRAEKRINLSLKHFTDDPWVHFEDKYHVNDIVKGKVTKLTEFGAFIEIEEGIEGLAHISEFSWVKKIQKPQEFVKPNDVVECMILGYDLQAGRVSLGLKQVTANPWDDIENRYPLGLRLSRTVVKITNAGAFINLEEGIDGFLHGDDISWTKKIKHPGSELSVGQEIEVMVISLDKENRNIRLGIKQLTDNPWQSFSESYHHGSQVEGEVASVTDFGIFVRVPGGIEGLIHKTNLIENRNDNPDDALKKFKVGDKIRAVVLEVQGDKQKLAFSIKDYQKKMQREELSRYMTEEEDGASTFTLGDIFKSKNNAAEEQSALNTDKDTQQNSEVPDAVGSKAGEEPADTHPADMHLADNNPIENQADNPEESHVEDTPDKQPVDFQSEETQPEDSSPESS